MFGDIIQPTHLIFILVVALLVLGPKRLPEVGRQLGRGMRDFRHGLQGVESEARSLFHDHADEPDAPTPATMTPMQTSLSSVASAPSPSPHFVIEPGPEPQSSPQFAASPQFETDSETSPHLVISPEPEPESKSGPGLEPTSRPDPASAPHTVISPEPQIAPAD